MAADDLYEIQPIAPLTPDELGLPPLPAPPQAPMLGPSPHAKKAQLLSTLGALGAALGAGPGPVGRGVSEGFLQGNVQRQHEQAQADHNAQVQYRQQQGDYEQAAQQYQQAQAQRDATYQRNVTALRTAVAKAPDKASADKLYETYAAGLQQMGYRVNANTLRTAAAYVAPTAESDAQKLLDRWMKNPANAELLKNSPEQAVKAIVPFDRDGDGELERVTLEELASIAQMPFAANAEGGAMFSPKGTTQASKANADGILQELVKKATAEGKHLTPDLMVKLQQQAIKLADQAKPEDPYLTEMRRMRTEEMRRRQNIPQELSPAQFNMANKLADDFTRDSKDFVQRAQSYQTVLAAAKDPSAAGDLSLIFAYMKMLDPGSVVREGEFATAQNTAGVPDRIRNVYNRMISGERLTPGQRGDFIKQAANVYGASKSRQDQIMATYRSRAARAQVPPDLVVMDYGIAPETETQQSDPKAAAWDVLKQRQGPPK